MPSELTGIVVVAAVVLAATAFGLVRRARDGKLRPPDQASTSEREVLTRLGVSDGTPVTLLQFSSAFCAPCRATRALCASVAAEVDGVRHIEVDAESHLDEVRALGIMRTPTLLVVDATGRVVRRAAGQPPTRPHLLAAVGDAMTAESSR
ncbi:TlpA family protein disulfide reductase [Planosporangium sp. 12N6]|uniref:TlpA family protein disulfide reductase n=1 Tax=Planosporangium spinosum TaxID=3402278 RepID=UPI003CFB03FB